MRSLVEVIIIPKAYTYEEVQNVFKKHSCTLLSDTYINTNQKLKYIASCGHENEMTLSNFIKQKEHLCRSCGNKSKGKTRKYTYDEVRDIFAKEGCTLVSVEYIGYDRQLEYIATCGHHNKTSLFHLLNGGSRLCKKCMKQKIAQEVLTPYEDVVKLFAEFGAEVLTTKEEYKGVKQSIKYRCSCGNISSTQVYHWRNGHTRCYKCKTPSREGNPNWKPDKPDYMRIAKRQYTEYLVWRKAVFERDNYICQCCGDGGQINAHHLFNYAEYIELQHKVSNGITLCKSCHDEFHKIYSRKNNSKEQMDEFINSHKARNDYQEASSLVG